MRYRVLGLILAGTSLVAVGAAHAQPAPVGPQAGAAGAAPSDPVSSTAPPVESAESGLQEIVVTAQRREENLQKVPVAVTSIGAVQLAQLRVVNVKDLSGVAPGLQIANQGLASNPEIVIRGITSGVSNNAVDPKVGIYIDGVYIGRTVGSLFDLADLQRVEVLRGPQGTLFGRNATAGAISLVTAPPTGKFDVRGNISYGNYDAKRGKVTIDLPAFGPFSAKVAYLHDEIEGDYRNLIGGRTIDVTPRDASFGTLTYAKRLGMRNIDGGQFALHGDFGNLTADYRFDYTDQKGTGRPSQILGRLPDATGALLSFIDTLQPAYGGITNVSTNRLRAVANATSVEHVVTQGHSLTLALQATDSFLLKSITAYRKFRQDPNIYDLAGSGGEKFTQAQLIGTFTNDFGAILNPANAPGPNDSFFSLLTSRKTSQSQISQEVQFQLTHDRYSLTAGIFLFHERSPATDVLGILQPVANGVILTSPFFLDPATGSGVTRTVATNDSYAGYAQLTFHVTDKLDVVGGVRGTIDDRHSNIKAISSGQGAALGVGNYYVSYRKLNYTGIITYRPTDHVNTYAKVATGYVAGGILSGIPYRPESLISYEVGLKSQLLDNKLRFNVAGYYEDYTDLQIQEFNEVQFFTNAGKANIKGVEAEAELAPVHGLLLSGNVGYTNFEFKRYISMSFPGINLAKVARFPYSSPLSLRVAAQYDAPEFSNGSHLYGRIDGTYRNHYYLNAVPYTTTPANPTTGTPVPVEEQDRRPGYWLVDGRVGLADLTVSGSKLALSGFINNALNKHYVSFGAPVLALTGTYERGRTYGVEFGFDF